MINSDAEDTMADEAGAELGAGLSDQEIETLENLVRELKQEETAPASEQRLDEMFGLVQGELQDRDLLDKLGAGVVLTGGTVAIPGIIELAQQIFASPVRLGVPREGLAGLADSVGRPRFAIATGLALWGADRFAETGRGASTITSGMFTKLGTWLKEFF